MNKDSLGDRMKQNYEAVTAYVLPRRTYTVIRLDGRAFHTWTRGLERPYCAELADLMGVCSATLIQEVAGSSLAYTQSDEVSLILTDFATHQTEPWMGAKLQKMCSLSASVLTAAFNDFRHEYSILGDKRAATFDSRVFTIPSYGEVENYLIWRQQDATRNSISMAAQSQFSHKELQGVNAAGMQDMMMLQKGINWNDYPEFFKRGQVAYREEGFGVVLDSGPPVFTQDREYLEDRIPLQS